MWNLLKSVFRSLKHNKVATIGLTFLVFLSTATFTVLNSTTTNINNQYNRIKDEGKIHDLTVSELYNNADPAFTFNLSETTTGDRFWGKSSDGITIPWPKINGKEKTWWFTLDVSGLDDSTPLKSFYDLYKDDSNYEEILFPHLVVSNDTEVNYVKNPTSAYVSKESSTKINSEIANTILGDSDLQAQISLAELKITNLLKQESTPMQKYLSSLEKEGKIDSFKTINSLNISNSEDKVFYKAIKSNADDVLDKVVLFNNSFSDVGRNNFLNSDWDPLYGIDDLDYDAIKGMNIKDILKIQVNKEYSTVTDSKEQNQIIAKFKIFAKGSSSDENPSSDYNKAVVNLSTKKWNDAEFKESYQYWYTYVQKNEFYDFSEHRLSVNYAGTVPINWFIENWTSYFSVFAPSHLKNTGKEPINIKDILEASSYIEWKKTHPDLDDDWTTIKTFFNCLNKTEMDSFIEEFTKSSSNKNKYFEVDNIVVIILGAGITPDYIYPIVSLDKPIPNTKDESVLFLNTAGYERLHYAFRGNQTEDYIVARLGTSVSVKNVIKEINEKGKHILSWPSNINCAYAADDVTNVLNASSFRIAYIPSFVEKVNAVDYLLTLFVVILGVLISLIVIRRYISNNRVNIGIMQANGIGKNKIAFSLTPFSLIPAIIGGVIGYMTGSLLQGFTLGLFNTYWVIPTPLLGFSWVALVGAITIPLVLFIGSSYVSTFILLREKAVNLMKYGSEFKTNIVSRFATRPFAALNVLTRFRISIAFNSIWKLMILCIMVALTMSTFVFGIAFDNKFDQSLSATSKSREYKYAIDLYSPTTQGGQYIPVDENSFGRSGYQTVGNDNEQVYVPSIYSSNEKWPEGGKTRKKYYDTTFSMKADDKDLFYKSLITKEGYEDIYHGNILSPMLADAMSMNLDIQYLKNKISTKSVMNFEVGIPPSSSANPWKIAKSLMPDNAINLSEKNTKKLINIVGDKAKNDPESEFAVYKDYFIEIKDSKNPKKPAEYEIDYSKIVEDAGMPGLAFYFKVSDESGTPIKNNFLNLLMDMYENANIENGENGINTDYSIGYNFVPISSKDETYTYLTVEGYQKNKTHEFKTDLNTKVVGIKAHKSGAIKTESEYINLVDKNGNNLLPLITYDESKQINQFPLVVNEFAARKHNVKVGDLLTFEITNKADRIQRKIDNNTKKSYETFKVVGINESFTGEEYFTNQDIANYILGLKTNIRTEIPKKLPNNYVDFSWFDEVPDNQKPKEQGLIDLSNSNGSDNGAMGFNGVFTRNENGGRILSNSISLYSPSGIWPGTDKITSPTFTTMLEYSASPAINCYLAVKLAGLESTDLGKQVCSAYEAWINNIDTSRDDELYKKINEHSQELANEIAKYYGQTAYVSLLSGVISASANEIVFMSMSRTINSIEQIIIVVITLMVGLIVMLITSIIIGDSKKMAGLLKALGYTDKENTITFLSTYLPVIGIGLLLAIPLSIGIVSIFQAAIFTGAKILLSTTIEWWYFPAGILLVVGLLSITGGLAYDSIKKERLVDLIK